MSEQQKQSLCPRLIDYLAIVGARSGAVQRTAGSNNNQSPVQVSFSLLSAGLGIVRERTWLIAEFDGECG